VTQQWTPEQHAHLAKVKAANPSILIDPDNLNLFAAQAICADMPDDASKEEFLFYFTMVGEAQAIEAVADGRVDEMLKTPVPKDTDVIVVCPSVVYYLDGKIRRGSQMGVAYATLTAIKLARLAGGNPRLVLASPDEDVVLDLAAATEGLNRQMRLEIADVVAMPSATNRGPLWTDADIVARLRDKFPPDAGA
jgi:hypothetical protein